MTTAVQETGGILASGQLSVTHRHIWIGKTSEYVPWKFVFKHFCSQDPEVSFPSQVLSLFSRALEIFRIWRNNFSGVVLHSI